MGHHVPSYIGVESQDFPPLSALLVPHFWPECGQYLVCNASLMHSGLGRRVALVVGVADGKEGEEV